MNLLSALWRLLLHLPEGPVRTDAITSTVIICADCSDEERLLPVKTFLTAAGRCHNCFGRSYQLASRVGPEMSAAIRRTREVPEYSDLSVTTTAKENQDHATRTTDTTFAGRPDARRV